MLLWEGPASWAKSVLCVLNVPQVLIFLGAVPVVRGLRVLGVASGPLVSRVARILPVVRVLLFLCVLGIRGNRE